MPYSVYRVDGPEVPDVFVPEIQEKLKEVQQEATQAGFGEDKAKWSYVIAKLYNNWIVVLSAYASAESSFATSRVAKLAKNG